MCAVASLWGKSASLDTIRVSHFFGSVSLNCVYLPSSCGINCVYHISLLSYLNISSCWAMNASQWEVCCVEIAQCFSVFQYHCILIPLWVVIYTASNCACLESRCFLEKLYPKSFRLALISHMTSLNDRWGIYLHVCRVWLGMYCIGIACKVELT